MAYLESGDHQEAASWFQRVAESGYEHIYSPIPYVRSFYFLGKIHENRGDMDKARECYRRFIEYWKDGDIDRERVEEAKRKDIAVRGPGRLRATGSVSLREPGRFFLLKTGSRPAAPIR